MRYFVISVWLAMNFLALLRPFFIDHPEAVLNSFEEAPWPSIYEGRELIRIQLSEQEEGFVRNFPGQVGRFHDGEREFIFRWVTKETRRLHPASDCMKGAGYSVHAEPLRVDHQGNRWGCFQAKDRSRHLAVCERIFDLQGNSWSDVSSWYWAALLQRTQAPWWAVTVAENLT